MLKYSGDLTAVRSSAEERRVVFVDLDHTLFDYTQARLNAARQALRHLFPSSLLDDALVIYQSVVDRWEAFELLGFPNLRRRWKCQDIYFIVKAMTSPEFAPYKEEVLERLLPLGFFAQKVQGSMDTREVVEMFRHSEIGKRFFSTIQRLRADVPTQLQVRNAHMEFERQTIHLEPFPDAREFIHDLRESGSMEVYLVSEGDTDVQWEKIENLGLADLFTPAQTIITDEIARPRHIFCTIEKAIASRERLLKPAPERTTSQSDLDTGLTTRAIRFEIKALEYYQGLFKRFKHKADVYFFARALHLVQYRYARGGINQDEFGNLAPAQWKSLPAFKLATVGDRYVADIRPLVQLVGGGGCLAIHVVYGKYSNETANDNDPKPDYEVCNLAQARNILLRDSVWNEKHCVPRPVHLGEQINAENASYVLAGFGRDMPKVVCCLAETIVQDNMIPTSILMPCFELSTPALLDWKKDSRARALITALIDQASLIET